MKLNQFAVYRVDQQTAGKHCGICHIKRQDSRMCRLLSEITD